MYVGLVAFHCPCYSLVTGIELDKSSEHNWLDDNIWVYKTYLERRDPVVVNTNWWLALQNDTNVPEEATAVMSGITQWQVRRAAWMLHRILDYKAQIDRYALF
jgi:carnitine O-acetyltransferase